MADPPPYTGLPRWVKVFGIVALAILVALFVVGMLTGGHGPGRHMSGGLDGHRSPASTVTQHV